MSENESTTYPNPLSKMKAAVRNTFIALKKQERATQVAQKEGSQPK